MRDPVTTIGSLLSGEVATFVSAVSTGVLGMSPGAFCAIAGTENAIAAPMPAAERSAVAPSSKVLFIFSPF